MICYVVTLCVLKLLLIFTIVYFTGQSSKFFRVNWTMYYEKKKMFCSRQCLRSGKRSWRKKFDSNFKVFFSLSLLRKFAHFWAVKINLHSMNRIILMSFCFSQPCHGEKIQPPSLNPSQTLFKVKDTHTWCKVIIYWKQKQFPEIKYNWNEICFSCFFCGTLWC